MTKLLLCAALLLVGCETTPTTMDLSLIRAPAVFVSGTQSVDGWGNYTYFAIVRSFDSTYVSVQGGTAKALIGTYHPGDTIK